MPTFVHAQQAVVNAGAKSFQEYAKAQNDATKKALKTAPKLSDSKKPKP